MSNPPFPFQRPFGFPPPMQGFPGSMPPMGVMHRPMMPMNPMGMMLKPRINTGPNIPHGFKPEPQGPGNKIFIPAFIADKSTTVYVGKIAPTVEDSVIRTLLEACGPVKSWKPQEDPVTKVSKGFGFCEFEDAEGVLRALRILNNLKLDSQELLLKCNQATQKYIDSYENQKSARKQAEKRKEEAAKIKAAEKKASESAAAEGESPESTTASEPPDAEVDEDEAADNRVLELLMSIVSEREITHKESFPPPPLVSGGMAADAGAATGDQATESSRERRRRDRELDREADDDRRRDEERRREQDAKYEARLREWERYERDRARQRQVEVDRQLRAESERRRQVRTDLESDSDDDRAPWERPPVRGSRQSAERRKRRLAEEADDDADRLRETREREQEAAAAAATATDARTEMEEMEEEEAVEEDVLTEEGLSVAKSAAAVDLQDPIFQAMLAAASAPPKSAPAEAAPVSLPSPTAASGATAAADGKSLPHAHHIAQHMAALKQESAAGTLQEDSDSLSGVRGGVAGSNGGSSTGGMAGDGALSGLAPTPSPTAGPRPAKTSGGSATKRGLTITHMFGDEDDEEASQKRKLVPIDYSEEELRALQAPPSRWGAAAGDPEAALRQAATLLPTTREGVFEYAVKWEHYNPDTTGDRVREWVGQKVAQLLGAPEATLVDYVMRQLRAHAPPAALHAELSPVLDSDTELFVIKLYRMVIYQTEKASLGL